MKKIFLASLVLLCLLSCLSLSVSATDAGNLEVMPSAPTERESFFSQFLELIKEKVSGYFATCAGNDFLAKTSYVVAILLLLFVGILGYRFYRPTTYVYGAALGFVLGFSLCSILDGPDWLLDASPFFNWAFAVLFSGGAVVLAVFFTRFSMSLFLATTLATVMALYVTNSTLLFFIWLCALGVFALAMKSFFIPLSSFTSALGLAAIFFSEGGLIPLSSWGNQLGFQGGLQPWLLIAIVLGIALNAIQNQICRGTKYY
jgi:hypothetical protein